MPWPRILPYAAGHDPARPLPPRRQGGDRHRRLLRPRRRLRRRPRRGRRRRRHLRPPRRPPPGDQASAWRPTAAAASRSRPTSPSPRTASASSRVTVAELGKADVLVNNAGIGTAVPATRETPEQFRKVIDINLNGSYWMAQAFARAIGEDGGSIVNIGSVLGSTTAGLPQAAYGASQGGDHRPHARPRAAVDGPQEDPRQRARARLLPVRDDRPVPRRLPRRDDGPRARRPRRRPGGAHRRAAVPRLRRVVLRHRRDCCRSTAGC